MGGRQSAVKNENVQAKPVSQQPPVQQTVKPREKTTDYRSFIQQFSSKGRDYSTVSTNTAGQAEDNLEEEEEGFEIPPWMSSDR